MPISRTWNGTVYSIPISGEVNWAALTNFLDDVAQNAQTTNFQKFASRKAVATPVTVSAQTDCVVVTNLTVAGAVAVNLPAGVNGQVFVIKDGKGDSATNNITITPTGGETIAGAGTLVLNSAGESVTLVYNSTDSRWEITSSRLPAASTTDSGYVTIGSQSFTGAKTFVTSAAVQIGAAVVTPASNANAFVISHDSASQGMSILTANNRAGSITFGDPQDASIGKISYDHSSGTGGTLSVTANNVTSLQVDNGTVSVPGGPLYVTNGAVAVTPAGSADNFIIQQAAGSAGLSILTANTSAANVTFGDPQDASIGKISYDHGTGTGGTMTMIANNVSTLSLENGTVKFPGVGTTASAANAFLDSGANNNILRSTSSIRYKKDIMPVNEKEALSVYSLKPIKYKSRSPWDDGRKIHFGLIAEDVEEVEHRLVQYTKNTKGDMVPDGVQYERVCVLLLAEMQNINKRINKLEGVENV